MNCLAARENVQSSWHLECFRRRLFLLGVLRGEKERRALLYHSSLSRHEQRPKFVDKPNGAYELLLDLDNQHGGFGWNLAENPGSVLLALFREAADMYIQGQQRIRQKRFDSGNLLGRRRDFGRDESNPLSSRHVKSTATTVG